MDLDLVHVWLNPSYKTIFPHYKAMSPQHDESVLVSSHPTNFISIFFQALNTDFKIMEQVHE